MVSKVIAGKAKIANVLVWTIFLKIHKTRRERKKKKSWHEEANVWKHGAIMSHKHRGTAGTEQRRRMSRSCEDKKNARKGEHEGGRKVLLKQLVIGETAPTPLPSSKANWLSGLTPHAQAIACDCYWPEIKWLSSRIMSNICYRCWIEESVNPSKSLALNMC